MADTRNLKENLDEIMAFLIHIEDRVGKEAFRHVYSCCEDAISQTEDRQDELWNSVAGNCVFFQPHYFDIDKAKELFIIASKSE